MKETKTLTFSKMFNPQTGKTMAVSGEESINNCLSMLISTCKGELLGDPNFGTNVKRLLMNFKGEQLYILVREEIVQAVNIYEKRVSLDTSDIQVIESEDDDNTVRINIMYKDLTDGTVKDLSLTLNGDEL